jgi:PAS domain-containing protein
MTDHALLQAPEVRALISYLDHEPAPMIVMNTDYQILAANTAYKRQFAVAGKPYLGHKCYAVSHHFAVPCDQAGEHCPLQSALATRAPDRVLHIHHTPRGPEHVDVELRPIVDAGHRVIGFVERLQTVRQASARASGRAWWGSRRPSTAPWASCSASRRRRCRCCCWANRAPARNCSRARCTRPAPAAAGRSWWWTVPA